MPDVYDCVKAAEQGLCKKPRLYAEKIIAIPDNLRVKAFKSKTVDKIIEFLQRGSQTIKEHIINTFYDKDKTNVTIDDIMLSPGSNDNKDGADVNHILLDGQIVTVEVKFGSKTDKNIGMEVFENIFGTDVFTKALSNEIRKSWLEYFDQDNDERAQFERLKNALNKAIDIFNKNQSNNGFMLDKEKQKYMESEIINASGSGDGLKKYAYYLKFVLKNGKFILSPNITTGKGTWVVKPVKLLSGNVKRVNVFVYNETTKVLVKYVLNWKNAYPHNDKKLMAKLGFGTPNWNAWIYVDVTDSE